MQQKHVCAWYVFNDTSFDSMPDMFILHMHFSLLLCSLTLPDDWKNISVVDMWYVHLLNRTNQCLVCGMLSYSEQDISLFGIHVV